RLHSRPFVVNVRVFHERAPQAVSVRSDRAKMADDLGGAAAFSCAQSGREKFRSLKTKILYPRHVSLPKRSRFTRRTHRRLYRDRYRCALQTDAWIQCPAFDVLGRGWF